MPWQLDTDIRKERPLQLSFATAVFMRKKFLRSGSHVTMKPLDLVACTALKERADNDHLRQLKRSNPDEKEG